MTTTLESFNQNVDTQIRGRETMICNFDLGSESDQWRNPTVYNPSILVSHEPLVGQKLGRIIFARLEEREDETSSQVAIMRFEAGRLTLVENAPRFKNMQDPYYLGTFVDPVAPDSAPYHVFGGVKIVVDPITEKVTDWQDTLFRIKTDIHEATYLGEPEPFAESSHHSKDLRFVQLPDGIAVCPRPQGEFGGVGRVGYFRTDNLDTLQHDLSAYFAARDKTTLIDGIFKENEWGGVNQMLVRPDGNVQLIGHKASRYVNNGLNSLCYRPFSAVLDPDTGQLVGQITSIGVEASEFTGVNPKRPDLEDVVFSSGIVPLPNPNLALFIGGVKDAAVGMKVIANPMLADCA